VTDVLICCGLGGTGKTTTAAALAIARAMAGQRVVVLTIDPARRLADALHLPLASATPTPVPLEGAAGSLHAQMLDRKRTWDAVVRRCAPDDATAERLLANRYYRAVSTRLTGSHEYMAIEALAELVKSGAWDTVILDTPPTQHLLDFLDAPDRIARVFDRSVLSALVEPGSGLFGAATRRAVGLVERVAGASVMADIQEFFRLFGGLSHHFREQGRAARAVLSSERTRYLLVVNARAPERADLDGFLQALHDRDLHLSTVIFTRVCPEPPAPRAGDALAQALSGIPDADQWVAAFATARQQAAFAAEGDRLAAARVAGRARVAFAMLPDAPESVKDLRGLQALAAHLAL